MDTQGSTSVSSTMHPLALIALGAFVASSPLLLTTLETLKKVLLPWVDTAGPIISLDNSFFLRGMMLAAMFAALAMLFVCLLKTAYGRLDKTLLMVGSASYLIGMVILGVIDFFPGAPSQIFEFLGVPIGFGSAIMCMAWMQQLHIGSYHSTLKGLAALALCALLLDGICLILSSQIAGLLLMALAVFGTIYCLVGIRRMPAPVESTVPGANWWDILGHLDVSLVDEGHDFVAPLQRVLLFVATPATMLLLLVLGLDLHRSASTVQAFPIGVVGGAIAIVLCIPLLVLRTSRRTMNIAYRFYLPIIAMLVFIAGNFAPEGTHQVVMTTGIYAFCLLYALIMCSTIVTMAGRMRSLRLPIASLLVVAAGLIALTGNATINAGALNAYKFDALLVLLILSALLLVSLSSGKFWNLVLEGQPANAEQITPAANKTTLEQRCQMVAEQYSLTNRETEILQYLGRGHGSAYIAEVLVVAESTVRSHVKSIYRKVGVSSREQLLEKIDSVDK